jgi:tetratricopeptide (TPR) repeat protein
MTSQVSYDTQLVPGATPAPIQQPIAAPLADTRVSEPSPTNPAAPINSTALINPAAPINQPAPINRPAPINSAAPASQPAPINYNAPINYPAATPAGRQSRGYGLLIVAALVVLLAAGGAAFMLLKPGHIIATNDPTPTPATSPSAATTPSNATPTPVAAQEDARLARARMAEAAESYNEAIDLYKEYLAARPSDPSVNEIKTHLKELQMFFGICNSGVFYMNKEDYGAAERDYADALKLRPDSKLAQEGLKKARSHQGQKD